MTSAPAMPPTTARRLRTGNAAKRDLMLNLLGAFSDQGRDDCVEGSIQKFSADENLRNRNV
jgi:hypothetical protein